MKQSIPNRIVYYHWRKFGSLTSAPVQHRDDSRSECQIASHSGSWPVSQLISSCSQSQLASLSISQSTSKSVSAQPAVLSYRLIILETSAHTPSNFDLKSTCHANPKQTNSTKIPFGTALAAVLLKEGISFCLIPYIKPDLPHINGESMGFDLNRLKTCYDKMWQVCCHFLASAKIFTFISAILSW